MFRNSGVGMAAEIFKNGQKARLTAVTHRNRNIAE
jgi:hypothetical protein